MSALTAMLLDDQARLLLHGFGHPRGSALQWNTRTGEWAIGSFGMSDLLLSRMDRLLEHGLVGFAAEVSDSGMCDVVLTTAGRVAIR